MTDWEVGFMHDIDGWEGELTDAQQDKVDEIENAICERRDLARQGLWPIS